MAGHESEVQILIGVCGFIAWHFFLIRLSSKNKSAFNRFINKLTQLTIFFIWLIGVSLAVLVFCCVED